MLGYAGEARRYHDYLTACFRQTLPRVQIMYGIARECDLGESVLEHLEGYAHGRPVRVGNDAFDQRQIDVYGQVLDLALLYERLGGRLKEQYRRLLRALAAFVAAHWREPDQGLWEMRGPPRHHVHGKPMSWVALDRASQVLRDGGTSLEGVLAGPRGMHHIRVTLCDSGVVPDPVILLRDMVALTV